MRHKILLVVLMLLIAAACLYLWLATKGELSSFGLNAFTETLGILVTVLIVDHLIKRQEEVRSLPQKAAAYEDVRLLTSRIVSFWSDVFRSCVSEASPSSVDDLFCQASFEKMRANLNLNSQPNVTPTRTWWEWLPESLSQHRELAETILARYNNVLDPTIYSYVHKIGTEDVDPNIINAIRQSDLQNKFPRPPVLGCYYHEPEHFCETVVALVRWCEEHVGTLEKNGVTGIRRVVSTIGPWDRQENPPSKIG